MEPTHIWLLVAIATILRATTAWRRKSRKIRSLRLTRIEIETEIRRAELSMEDAYGIFRTRPVRERHEQKTDLQSHSVGPEVLLLILIFLPLYLVAVASGKAFGDVLSAFLKIAGCALLAALLIVMGYRLYMVGLDEIAGYVGMAIGRAVHFWLTSWVFALVSVAPLLSAEMYFRLAEQSAADSVKELEAKKRDSRIQLILDLDRLNTTTRVRPPRAREPRRVRLPRHD